MKLNQIETVLPISYEKRQTTFAKEKPMSRDLNKPEQLAHYPEVKTRAVFEGNEGAGSS
jgi:hypothetical protein